MKTARTITYLIALLIVLTGLLNLTSVHVDSSSDHRHEASAFRYDLTKVKESYARIPLSFVPNYGQANKKVKFTSRGNGYSLALAPTTFTMAVANSRSGKSASVVQATLLGGNAAAKLTPQERLLTRTNYFIGSDPRTWKTNVPNYAKVKYSGVYRGVDVVFYGNQDLLEYDFIVSPETDPGVIALGFDGISDMRIDEQGDLLLRTDAGEIRQSRPVVYQEINNTKRIIPAGYLIKGKNQVTFQIANHDRSKPLVIDPTLAFSTYLGGSSNDRGNSIAVDATGDAYITGNAASADFPITPGAFQTEKASLDFDVFVTKMNSTGTALIYSTYFGGGNREAGNNIAVDAAGNAYVTGLTDSSDIPTTPGAFRTTPVGSDEFDAFAFKLNATGTALVYSTFLGGSGFDTATEVAIDSAGNAYVTGQAAAGFPVTPGAFQTSFNGVIDAFVTKLNTTGTALVYSTFLGGSGFEFGTGIAVNPAGNAYVTGVGDSSNFPTTPGAFQTVKGAGQDAFVTKLSATGNDLAYSTFLGGDEIDVGQSIALDAAGNASVVGVTASTDFPTTADAIQSAHGGNNDAFITRLNATGTGLVFSTYLGGSSGDAGLSVFVDLAGSIYLTGTTESANFPTTPGAFQTLFGGLSDGFVAKIVFSDFDVCFTDDGNGNLFQFDSTTGEYKFTQAGDGGLTLTGTGTLSEQGCLLVLEDNQSGRRVMAHLNQCNNKGHAVIQIESEKKSTFVINDKDTANSNCGGN